jgi:hypothetical protein
MPNVTWTELSERINRLKPGAPGKWGKMQLGQMLVHCRIQLETGYGEFAAARRDNFLARTLMKWMVFSMPFPKGKAETHPEWNVQKRGLSVRSEAEEVKALSEAAKRFAQGGFKPAPHPVLGPMDLPAWDALMRKHLDYHLKQFGG